MVSTVQVWREIKVLQLFAHPHIIRLYEVSSRACDMALRSGITLDGSIRLPGASSGHATGRAGCRRTAAPRVGPLSLSRSHARVP